MHQGFQQLWLGLGQGGKEEPSALVSRSWVALLRWGCLELQTCLWQLLEAKLPSCSRLLRLIGCKDQLGETVVAAGLAFLRERHQVGHANQQAQQC